MKIGDRVSYGGSMYTLTDVYITGKMNEVRRCILVLGSDAPGAEGDLIVSLDRLNYEQGKRAVIYRKLD